MSLIQHILVPTDFSENSKHAIRYAIMLAKATKAKLTLFHTYHIPIPYSDADFIPDTSYTETLEKEANEGFDKLVADLPELSAVEHEQVCDMSFLLDGILEYIAKHNTDLIVMGTKGASGIQEIILGSNTAAVIEKASCPVLAVPEKAPLKPIQLIAFASDYSDIDEKGKINVLIELAKTNNAEVHVLNVTTAPEKATIDEASVAIRLNNMLDGVIHSYHLSETDDVEEGIQNYVKENGVDLIAMMPKKHDLFDHLFHKSNTQRLAMHSVVPLLSFHD